jgi:hypothetical protein
MQGNGYSTDGVDSTIANQRRRKQAEKHTKKRPADPMCPFTGAVENWFVRRLNYSTVTA